MTDFLLFTVYAPLVSWGDIAVGEIRASWDRPSRSAVLGLVAAALGISRDDQAAHDALDIGYGFGVRLDAPGTLLVDYHTTQTVAAAITKRTHPSTRAELLASGDRETVVSRRTYRADALATAILWAHAGAKWPLSIIADALRRPVFVLYGGRKSNALGLPAAPETISASTLAAALADRTPGRGVELLRPRDGWGGEVAYDLCDGFGSGMERQHHHVRRDAGAQRSRWQFRNRVMEVGHVPPASASPKP